MSVKLSGDLYLTNISPRLGNPVETSLLLFKAINAFLATLGLTQRYGKIAYIIVKGKTAIKCNNYVAFLSLEDTSKHFELKENLTNLHFDGQKVFVKFNIEATDPSIRQQNRSKFKRNLDENEKLETSQNNKRKRAESNEESADFRQIISVEKTSNEDSNDSYTSLFSSKNESKDSQETIDNEDTNPFTLKEQNSALKIKLIQLNNLVQEHEKKIEELKTDNCRLIENNNESRSREFNLAVELAVVKQRNEDLLKEREETVKIVTTLQKHLN